MLRYEVFRECFFIEYGGRISGYHQSYRGEPQLDKSPLQFQVRSRPCRHGCGFQLDPRSRGGLQPRDRLPEEGGRDDRRPVFGAEAPGGGHRAPGWSDDQVAPSPGLLRLDATKARLRARFFLLCFVFDFNS